MAIWRVVGVKPSAKWVDDVVIFRSPLLPSVRVAGDAQVFAYDREQAKEIIACLGAPWHLFKGQDFNPLFIYVGFLWSLLKKSVRITDDKLARMLQKLAAFLERFERRPCPLDDILSIHGSLSHITFVYPQGAAYLTSLSSFAAKFDNSLHAHPRPRFAPPSMWTDIRWWIALLQSGPQIRSLAPLGMTKDVGIWVDASTDWGVGLVWQNRECAAWRWKPGWNHAPGCDIGWGEAIAVELAIILLDRLAYSNARILIRSDNTGVIGAFRKQRSRNWMVNQCIRRSNVLAMARNLVFTFEYVASEDNLADPISRGVGVPGFVTLPTSVPLPEPLVPFLEYE